ncbi:MAG: Gfo/Idh/MocA family oxidoreductase [Bifidobacterium ruminantium]|uniref:Gfo/Idh/MocA family protein n=1 Tax=uncultured Bifidobacterium sp. TaxID=165187 RepID=UPI002582A9C7|nr:Gfo/Idh/MocA family oxidoreductase [uncultured Bifidobacterium sp.]MEE0970947.1 Gfo/Idh/MocA family oxidoreductase [Bifidobacterium ruminantium]
MAQINAAILGAGRIAQSMAKTLVAMAADERYRDLVAPYAVAARDGERAAEFAAKYGFPVSYGSYEELAADPNVNLVYIATPHNFHAEQAVLCMRAGKGVLVEKAFGANAAQSQEMLDVSAQTGMLCTEAIWTRYMPSRAMIDDIIASGAIGEVQAIEANLCYPTTAKARITDPALAGGALLDVGVYPINFIDMIMHNAPIARIESSMQPFETGVDAHDSMTFYYENGVMATAQSSILCHSDRMGAVWGTKGYLTCQNINNVESIDVFDGTHTVTAHYDVPAQLTGYEYEVAAAAQAVLDGRTECAEMPHADTMRIMKLMDSLRADWELTYPFEA